MNTNQKTKTTSPSGTPLMFTYKGAGGGIRTHERLRDRVLSPAPLTWLGDPRRLPLGNENTLSL
jgi:hypothetical protein